MAKQLKLPLDVIIVKKIGFPGNEELAIGAAGREDYFLNELAKQVPKEYVKEQIKIKQREAKKRYELLRGKKPGYKIKGKTVIIVDDGIATGATVIMAAKLIKKQSPKKLIVATPVAPPEAVFRLKKEADEVVSLSQPEYFAAIGQFYENFQQVEDKEAKELLAEANK